MTTFDRFVLDRRKDLKRIARDTRGDCQFGDVVNEAWMMAQEFLARGRVAVDFLEPDFQKLLLSHLYQHLVRYTESNVRRAVRLDHAAGGDADEGASNPLLNTLVSDAGNHPLSYLIVSEERASARRHESAHHSLAGAYIVLLRHFDNRMRSVAEYLLISLPHAYRCCAKARWLAVHQMPIALATSAIPADLGPWRRHRVLRIPQQLEFDFEEEFPLVVQCDGGFNGFG